ncbi:tRNA pseudouridine synthase A [Micractinium conductrix]|uniref:tRNA pseudouridine synthase A n=1 Tax=Micractinium conductrix TaxID=554055 RepID=A0A2P6VG19_9CHLO|nr:tRNA pseudouridine synthase A [Micractinium conductrix]|eukprot:PSC73018.1 tRNA pseudouridine synthase A [Micractinium conductrix]
MAAAHGEFLAALQRLVGDETQAFWEQVDDVLPGLTAALPALTALAIQAAQAPQQGPAPGHAQPANLDDVPLDDILDLPEELLGRIVGMLPGDAQRRAGAPVPRACIPAGDGHGGSFGASNHEDLPGGAQLVDWDLDGFLSDRQRPLLTESTLAAMPEGLRKRTALQRIFYLAYQMDANGAIDFSVHIVHNLANSPVGLAGAINLLDDPVALAQEIIALGEAGWGVPAAYRVLYPLRSSADVLAAAAALPADGQRVPWSPAAHVRWPVTFRLATRAFLLSKARTRRMVAAAGEAAVPLGAAALDSLPDELVESIVAAAAHPVAASPPTQLD